MPAAARAVPAALRDAAFASAIAFVLFAVLVGIKTENAAAGLALVPRFGLAALLALAVGLAVLAGRALRLRRAEPARSAGHLRGAALLAWAAGAILFFVPAARGGLAALLAAVSDAPAWRSYSATFVDLLAVALAAAFVVLSAMALFALLAAWREPARGSLASAAEGRFAAQGPAALLLIALVLPLLVAGGQQRYALDTAIQVLTFIMLGWGLNIVVGLAGLLDLGYVAFFAVGAYTTALLGAEGWSFWAALPVAGLAAAAFGIMLGFPVLRLRGDYLAIVTLAFGEIIRIVLLNWSSVTGGSQGLTVDRLTFFGIPFTAGPGGFADTFGIQHSPVLRIVFLYYLILALALLTNLVTLRLRRLPIGRAWEALREDEIAARALGLNTVTIKLAAFAIGASFGGLAGAFFATRQGFISPESFTFTTSALVLAIVVLGGLGSQLGIVIAATILIGASEFFRDLEAYRMLLFGALMVVIMVARPRGLVAQREPSVRLP